MNCMRIQLFLFGLFILSLFTATTAYARAIDLEDIPALAAVKKECLLGKAYKDCVDKNVCYATTRSEYECKLDCSIPADCGGCRLDKDCEGFSKKVGMKVGVNMRCDYTTRRCVAASEQAVIPVKQQIPTQLISEEQRACEAEGKDYKNGKCVDQKIWLNVQKKCNDPKVKNLELNPEELIAYLTMLEATNSDSDWKKNIAKLHFGAYQGDVDLELVGVRLFKHGSESDGYEKVKFPCDNFPKFVMQNGKKIDIAHSYAGLRSDLNRKYKIWKAIMVRVNTNWGDHLQNIERSWHNLWKRVTFSGKIDNGDYAPPDQLAGDDIGLWLKNYYSKKENKDKPLSQAYADYFSTHK